ncbi:hypothetical protein KSP40_PGU002996 [Platanthera guangdongensis]|uniref:Uncharacterized protein n=1 Tax=Platanthera guangdongensis TaxID=2320717 RepID=A0ABR2MZ95_9ASPA
MFWSEFKYLLNSWDPLFDISLFSFQIEMHAPPPLKPSPGRKEKTCPKSRGKRLAGERIISRSFNPLLLLCQTPPPHVPSQGRKTCRVLSLEENVSPAERISLTVRPRKRPERTPEVAESFLTLDGLCPNSSATRAQWR